MSGQLHQGEHRSHVTIVFCDVCNSSGLALELEPEEYSALLANLRTQAETIVKKHGGQIVRIDGDGFIIIFGYPDPHSNSAQRAIEATLSLHESAEQISKDASLPNSPLQLHSGIHGGVTLIKDGDMKRGRYEILGNPTNITARLCDYAQAGEIVISNNALGNNRNRYICSDPRSVKLRGQKREIVVRKILHRSFESKQPDAVPAFRGRTRELEWVLNFLNQPATEQSLGVIIGEAGMGKSRLLQEVMQQSRLQRPFTFITNCEAFLDSRPLATIQKLLLNILDTDSSAFGWDIAQDRAESDTSKPILARLLSRESQLASKNELSDLADEIIAFLKRCAPESGITLIFDDWHWVDEMTEAIVNLLLRRKRNLNLHILIVSRHDADPLFDNHLKQVLRLPPLDENSVRELIADLVELPEPSVSTKIISLSEGNPLFVGEFCHAANEGADALELAQDTSWLHALTNARFQKLNKDLASVVKSAAVIGFDVSRELLQEVSDVTLDDQMLADLQSADFLFRTPDPDRLKFKHGLTRSAVYSLIGLKERRARHQKVIDIQQRVLAPDRHNEAHNQLAYHYSGANLPEQSLEHALIAGNQALRSAALDGAQKLFAFALEEYKKIEKPTFGIERILYQYGLASIVDPGKDHVARIDEVRSWSARHNQPIAAAWAQYWLAFVYYGIGRPKDALQEFISAREAGLSVGDQELVSRITGTLGQVYAATCDYTLAIPALEHSIGMQMQRYEKSKNPAAPAYSTACLGFVLADQGKFHDANVHLEKAVELVAGRQHQAELSVRAFSGVAQMWQGNFQQAWDTWQWIIEHGNRMRSRYHIAKAKALLGISEFFLNGSPDSLEAVCRIADSKQLASQQRMSLVHGFLTECFAQIGDSTRSKKYATKTLRRSLLGDRLGDAQAYRSLAQLAALGQMRKPVEYYADRAIAAASERASIRDQALNHFILSGIAGQANTNAPDLKNLTDYKPDVFYSHRELN